MKKLRNFECDQCGVFERFAKDNDNHVKCECGLLAFRMLSAPKYFSNTTGKSPATR